MHHVRILPSANIDLIEIADYLYSRNVSAADRILDAINERIENLRKLPLSGPLRDDLSPGLRYFVEKDYLVFYRVEDEEVHIIRVLHGKRDLDAEF